MNRIPRAVYAKELRDEAVKLALGIVNVSARQCHLEQSG